MNESPLKERVDVQMALNIYFPAFLLSSIAKPLMNELKTFYIDFTEKYVSFIIILFVKHTFT